MSKLAIVVPVYNVEQYLDKCISSILEQDYKDFTLVLVDDGSTDSSGKKCDEWERADERVRTFHKKNGGLMSAWKYGVKKSESYYIGFVDSDDWIEPNMYRTLIEKALNNDADIVTCGLIADYEKDNTSVPEVITLRGGLYNKDDIANEIYPVMISGNNYTRRGFSPNRVTKIFKRTLLEECFVDCDDEVSIGEDLLTTFCCIQKANRVFIINDYFPYHYRINQKSMIQKYSDKKYAKIDLLYQHMMAINERGSYDFSKQISTDYIKLLLMQLDTEILFSKKNSMQLLKSMKHISGELYFQNAIRLSEWEKLPIKYKLYVFFFNHHLFLPILIIRKMKKV